jgi:hypothetical protein
MSDIEPSWFPDPSDQSRMRWWNGSAWSQMSVSLEDARIGQRLPDVETPQPVAPAANQIAQPLVLAERTVWKPTTLFWVAGGIVGLLAIVELAAGGFGTLFAFLGLVGIITAAYAAVTRRPSWANFPSGPRIRGIAIGASAVLFIIGASLMPSSHNNEPLDSASKDGATSLVQPLAGLSSSSRSPVIPTSTPSATPSPSPVIDLAEYSGTTVAAAVAELDSKGVFVVTRTSDGQIAPADLTGWTIVSQTPASGVGVYDSSTVTFIVAPPAPPEPAAPAPAPAPPAAPVAPGGGATARCNDGTFSYAAHHQGACSHHGGVAEFYK